MKYLKSFEKIRTDRLINIGDTVIWKGHNKEKIGKNSYVQATSNQVMQNELCEITKLKTIKGKIFAKAKNKETGKSIMLNSNGTQSYLTHPENGNWIEFDRYFISELDYDTKKYNL